MKLSDFILSTAVVQGLDILGDRWTILILRDAFLGRSRFEEFRAHTGAPRSTLSTRLDNLILNGVLYKKPYSRSPLRFEYRLTDKGMGLYPWALLIWDWERRWAGSDELPLPAKLFHKHCNHFFQPRAACRHCHAPLKISDVRFRIEYNAIESKPELPTKQTRARNSRASAPEDRTLGHLTNLLGDRWTPQVLAARFLGFRRYDEFRRELKVATNILADRLKQLVDGDILVRRVYQHNPPRHEYHLTEKGRDLYPLTMALHQWIVDWLPDDRHLPLTLNHIPCGHELEVDVICDHCDEQLLAGEVRIG